MAQIDFKNVGHISGSRAPTPSETSVFGIKTPLRFGTAADGIFSMHTSLREQIRDNLRNLLLTNHGERVCFADFGANIRPLLFDLTTNEFDSQAATRIKTAVSKYMPYIELRTLSTSNATHNEGVAVIKMQLVYEIPMLAVTNQSIELTFYVGG